METKSETEQEKGLDTRMDINAIMEIIPHRYPFLLIDRVDEFHADRIVGTKNVTMNEPFFQGHFPQRPIMPGVLILEALAQLAGILILSRDDHRGKLAYFASIDKAKFRRMVGPGDVLKLQVDVISLRKTMGKVHGTATVNGEIAAEADLMFAVEK